MRVLGLVFVFILINTSSLKADEVYFKFGNSHSALPFSRFSKLLYQEFHTSYELGKRFTLKEKNKYQWFQTANLGYFRHKFVQSGILLYSENGIARTFKNTTFVNAKLGLGYYHMFTGTEITKQNSNGAYEIKRDWGRPQALITLGFAVERSLVKNVSSAPKVILDYQIRMQTPFVKSYVPLLPYNSLKIGISFPLHNKNG